MTYHPLSIWEQFLQTGAFSALNIVAALLLLQFSPRIRSTRFWPVGIRILLPAIALGVIFFIAAQSAVADRAVAQIRQFRVPLASVVGADEIERDGKDDIYFVVGDQLDGSDLVVSPYSDAQRSQQVLGPASRPLVQLIAKRSGDLVETSICLFAYAADERSGLPGMIAKGPDVDLATHLDQGQTCRPLLAGDDAYEVAISRIEPHSGRLPSANDIKERRELRIAREGSGAGEGVIIRMPTPITADIGNCAAPRMRLMPSIERQADLDYLPASNFEIPQIGAGGMRPLLDPRLLGKPIAARDICDALETKLRWPSGPSVETRVSGTIKRTFLPLFPFALVLVSSVVLYGFRARAWVHNGLEGGVVFALQWLLQLRILIGIGGLYANPSSNGVAVMWDVTLAYVTIPIMAVGLMMPRQEKDNGILGGLGLYVILATGAIGLWLNTLSMGLQALFLPLAAIAILALRAYSTNEKALVLQAWEYLAAGLNQTDAWEFGWKFIGLFVAPRLLLALIGLAFGQLGYDNLKLTETIGPFRLSIIYTPAMIIGFAALLAGFRQAPTLRRMTVMVALFAIAFFGVAWAVRDFGIIMIFAWPIGAAIAVSGFVAALRQRQVLAALGILAPVLAPLTLFVYAWFLGQSEIPKPGQSGGLVAHLEAVVGWEDNLVRLLRYARPDHIELLGTRPAFTTMDQAASLDPLGRTLIGNGYLVSANVPDPLIRFHYSDNLPAIHIIWPFGKLGAAAFLTFLFCFKEAYRSRPMTGTGIGRDADMLSFCGNMASATLLWAGVYMTLANLNLVPFTGRNIYFLAVTSGADLVEGLILTMLAILPWLRPQVPDTPTGGTP